MHLQDHADHDHVDNDGSGYVYENNAYSDDAGASEQEGDQAGFYFSSSDD